MTVSIAAPARAGVRSRSANPATVYGAALAFWLATRALVLVHQGAWPWMNSFVVAAARGIVVGDWNDAVRPQLPAIMGVPLALANVSEQHMVAVLYLVASLVQFAAFVVLLRTLFPANVPMQTLALVVFLLLPFNHSIHHYRDMPVVLASAAIFLLGAEFVRRFAAQTAAGSWTWGRVAYISGLMLVGIWSRIEVLAFVGVLSVVSLVVYRRRAFSLVAIYLGTAALLTATLLVMYRIEDVDLGQAWFYTAHTFLDSTPDSWLTPECRANPTENCREADGLTYFGPANLRDGVLALATNHPLVTVAKSLRSAWDNAWVLVGPNPSTFPLVVPFLVIVAAVVPEVRRAYRIVPLAGWIIAVAIAAESVLPPLTWAPPHPQYHVALVVPIVLLLVPALYALLRFSRARWVAFGFLALEAALSAFRYTRYAGY